jgi:glycosyltransferase involved in cell wall biosynthesis
MLGWALNEQENVAGYIDRAEAFLRSISDDFEVILIDDGSTDRTREIITENMTTRPWLRLYVNERNRGAGYNAKRAISLAAKQYVFWQTVDWSYDISSLSKCWPLLRQYDALQGVRQNTVSLVGLFKRRSDNPYKGFVSVVNYVLVRTLFGLPLHDYQNVTVYPRALIQSVLLESESAFINPECLLKTWWKGASFKEFPVPFLKRERGKSAGTRPTQIAYAFRDILRYWLRWIVLGRRPDKKRGSVSYWSEAAGPESPVLSLTSRTSAE